jgi:K+-transporting ATPase A subunit
MMTGRFPLALAGGLVCQLRRPVTSGELPTDSLLFAVQNLYTFLTLIIAILTPF